MSLAGEHAPSLYQQQQEVGTASAPWFIGTARTWVPKGHPTGCSCPSPPTLGTAGHCWDGQVWPPVERHLFVRWLLEVAEVDTEPTSLLSFSA